MTIIQQIDSNIPPKFITKSPKNNYNYGYIRNNEVEYEWKLRNDKSVDKNDRSMI